MIQCIVGVTCMGSVANLLLLYKSCTTEAGMTKQLTQHLRVEHTGEAKGLVNLGIRHPHGDGLGLMSSSGGHLVIGLLCFSNYSIFGG